MPLAKGELESLQAALAKGEPLAKGSLESLQAELRDEGLLPCFSELMALPCPPAGVEDVGKAILALMGEPQDGRHFMKRLRKRSKFFKDLMGLKELIDQGQLPHQNVRDAKTYLELPELKSPGMFMRKAGAAVGLYNFLRNILVYYDVVAAAGPAVKSPEMRIPNDVKMLDVKMPLESERQTNTMCTVDFKQINKKDLHEIASLKYPPVVVKIVTGVFMILDGKQDLVSYYSEDMDIKGLTIKGGFPDGYAAFMKGLNQGRLKDCSAYHRLKQMIDDGQMPLSNVLEAKRILEIPWMSVRSVGSSSGAAAGLCHFMHQLVAYYEWKNQYEVGTKDVQEDGSSRPRHPPMSVKKQCDNKSLDMKAFLEEDEMCRLMVAQMMASPPQHTAALAAGMASFAKIVAPLTLHPSAIPSICAEGQGRFLMVEMQGRILKKPGAMKISIGARTLSLANRDTPIHVISSTAFVEKSGNAEWHFTDDSWVATVVKDISVYKFARLDAKTEAKKAQKDAEFTGRNTAAPSDLDLLNSKGQSCLLLAALHGIDSLVKAQVEAGAKVELRDEQDRTSLMMAISHGHVKTAHLLIAPTQGQKS